MIFIVFVLRSIRRLKRKKKKKKKSCEKDANETGLVLTRAACPY